MTWALYDTHNVMVALLIAWSAGLLGTQLLLRKMVMIGDAISHAVLPGVVIAYLLSNQSANFWILLLAGAFGVISTFIIDFLHRFLRLQEDASIGLTFTWLFALGVVILSFSSGANADIDQECILFGELGLSFLDQVYYGETPIGSFALWTVGPLFLIIVLVLWKGNNGWLMVNFGSAYSQTRGVKTNRWHYGLMTLVSLLTIFSFESVGAVLVLGFLVLPPASAYLLNSRYGRLLFTTMLISTVSVLMGYVLAIWLDINFGATIVSVQFACFLVVLLTSFFKQSNHSSQPNV